MRNHQASDFILIVDDSPTNLAVLAKTLEEAGFEVRVAIDGKSAIEKVNNEPPVLILLDIEMPGISGFETCIQLKSNPATQEIPVIFMTALSEIANKVKGLSIGAVDYITKPFAQEEVLARVRVHLQLHQLRQTLEEKNAQLERFAQELEKRVEERTVALQAAQLQLVQQEKLSALGELVAGIAHELNNPIGCITNNLHPAQEYFDGLTHLISLYQQHYPTPLPMIQQALEDLNLEFVLEDIPKLLHSMQLCTARIRDITSSLRHFARSDSTAKVRTNIHAGLDSTLTILRHRLKANDQHPEIQVVKHYGNVPEIECYPGPINQVFMNLLANAVDALEEAFHSTIGASDNHCIAVPQIQIQTEQVDQSVIIRIADNGIGMTPEVQARVFDNLFTTKATGKGTGMGLSIARQIVEDQHQGTIQLQSNLHQGTEFTITLPS